MKLCECGCGQEVNLVQRTNKRLGIKKGQTPHRFIYMHHRRGRNKENDEGMRRMAEKKRGCTKENDERVRRQAKIMKQKYASGEITHWSKGFTKKTHPSIARGSKKHSKTMTGCTAQTHEHLARTANTKRGRTKETHEYLRIAGEKISKTFKQKYASGEMVSYFKKIWEDPILAEELRTSILKGNLKRPTSHEQRIIDLINEHDLQYKYVGNGEVWIGNKNPDFIEINGKKLLIEVYNSYFKGSTKESCKQYEKERYQHFAKYGYKTIFLNEFDLFRPDWGEHCLEKLK